VQRRRLISGLYSAGQMVAGEHGMRLATAEIGLQANDRIATLLSKPLSRRAQHAAQSLGQVGNSEEGERIGVFLRTNALIDVRQIRGELRIGEARL